MGQFDTQPTSGSATATATTTPTDSSFSIASASAGSDYSPQEEQQRQALVSKFETTMQYNEATHAQQVLSDNLEVLLIRNPEIRQLIINPSTGNIRGYSSNPQQGQATIDRQDKLAEDLARGIRQGTIPTGTVGFDEWSAYWKQEAGLNYANFVGGQYLADYKAQFTAQRNDRVQSMEERKDAALLRRLEAIPGHERTQNHWDAIERIRGRMEERAERSQTPAERPAPVVETDPVTEAVNRSEYALRMKELEKELTSWQKNVQMFSGRSDASSRSNLAFSQRAVERTELLIDAELRLQALRLLPQSPENDQKIETLTEFRQMEQQIQATLKEVRGLAPLVRAGNETAKTRYAEIETWMRENADYRQGGDLRLPNKEKFKAAYEIIAAPTPTP